MTKTESKIPPKPKDYPFNDYCWQNDQKVKEAYLKQPIYSREEVMEHMRIAREELEKKMEEERKQKEKNKKDYLTSSSCHPKALVKEFSYFLMPCHQHCLGVNLLVQR